MSLPIRHTEWKVFLGQELSCYERCRVLSGFSGLILTDKGELESLLQEQQLYDPHESVSLEAHFYILSLLLGSSVLQSSFQKVATIAKEKGYLLTEDYTKGRIFGMSALKTENFTPEDLKNFSVHFYKRIRNLYLLQMMQHPSKLLRNAKVFIKHPVSTIKIAKIATRYLRTSNSSAA